MKTNKSEFIPIFIIVIIMGIISIFYSTTYLLSNYQITKDRIQVQGIIIDNYIGKEKQHNGKYKEFYYFDYQFIYNDKLYTNTSSVSTKNAYDIGDNTIVYVKDNDVNNNFILNKRIENTYKTTNIIGCIFVLIGILGVLILTDSKKYSKNTTKVYTSTNLNHNKMWKNKIEQSRQDDLKENQLYVKNKEQKEKAKEEIIESNNTNEETKILVDIVNTPSKEKVELNVTQTPTETTKTIDTSDSIVSNDLQSQSS